MLDGGGERDRTDDLLVANQALSQLSYGPAPADCGGGGPEKSRTSDLPVISRAL